MSVVVGNLAREFAVLRPDQSAELVPVTPELYANLERDYGGFAGHSLAAIHAFSEDWSTWERHPAGDELVVLLEGEVTLVLEQPEGEEAVSLNNSGDFVIVPQGVWHTARTSAGARMLFVTPGEGTENRAR